MLWALNCIFSQRPMSICLELGFFVPCQSVRSRFPLAGIIGARSPLDGVSLQVRPKETVLGSRPFIVELWSIDGFIAGAKTQTRVRKKVRRETGPPSAHRLPRLASSRAARPGCRGRPRPGTPSTIPHHPHSGHPQDPNLPGGRLEPPPHPPQRLKPQPIDLQFSTAQLPEVCAAVSTPRPAVAIPPPTSASRLPPPKTYRL